MTKMMVTLMPWVVALAASAVRADATAPDTQASFVQQVQDLRRQMEEERKTHAAEMKVMEDKMEAQRQDFDAKLKTVTDRMEATSRPAPESPSFYVPTSHPQTEGDVQGQLQSLQERVLGLENRETQPSAVAGVSRAVQSLNPDISLVGDFLAHADSRGEQADFGDQFLLREVELAISSPIDAYAKGDVFLSVSEDPVTREFGIDVEEAYVTLLTLPLDLQAKVGRFKAEFGKANTFHPHALPWVDFPLVIRRLLGDEGLQGEGVSVSHLIPNPWDKYIELTYQVFGSNMGGVFSDSESTDLTNLVHLKNFFDLSQSSTLEVGLSGATSPNGGEYGGQKWVEGADVTYKWRPPQQGLYKSILFMNEIIATQQEVDSGQENAWGAYSALEYQLTERWFAGVRYDFSELPENAQLHEHAGSAYLTFRQTEFCYWRLAYQHSMRNFDEFGSDHDDQVWLQLNFSLGAHPAHKY